MPEQEKPKERGSYQASSENLKEVFPDLFPEGHQGTEQDTYEQFMSGLGKYKLPNEVLDRITEDNYEAVRLNLSVLAQKTLNEVVAGHILITLDNLETKAEDPHKKIKTEIMTAEQLSRYTRGRRGEQ